jgi:uncharacterized protein (DUF1800 family)
MVYQADDGNWGIPPSNYLAYATREKIVFFLHSVFTTIQSKVDNSRSLYFQNQLYRKFAFDKLLPIEFNIKTLIKKVSVDNAMLRLLDGNQNVNGSVNENYGRELQELYYHWAWIRRYITSRHYSRRLF